jgi:hypothetical protein
MLKILALDLGTHTGCARNFGPMPWATTWHLAKAKEVTEWGKQRLDRRCDPRIERFHRLLTNPLVKPDLVVFEDVEFSTYTLQTQLWSAFRTVVWMTFDRRAVIECVPVSTLKKFATGNGGADKTGMKCSLDRQFPGESEGLDDNAIDALWILKWAEKNLSRMIIA